MNRTSILALAAFSLLSGLPGCTSEGDGGGTGGGAGGGPEDGGAVDIACTQLEPEGVATPTLRVTNGRAEPIFFPYCEYRFSVDVDGQLLPAELTYWYMASCADVVEHGPACCGCEIPQHEIAPGATFDLPWTGLGYEAGDVDRACVPNASDDNFSVHEDTVDCYRGRAIPEGPARLVLHLFATGSNADSWAPTDPFDVEVIAELGAATPSTIEVTVGESE